MKKTFRILKFKKDTPIFEIKDITKSFNGRPILKKLSLKDTLVNVLEFWVQMDLVKQLYFLCVLGNNRQRVVKLF